MAEHLTSLICIINDLLSRGHEFSFAQVMRLCRAFLNRCGKGSLPELPWQERVRVRPDLSLAFPPADVAQVERDGELFRVTATFLGLYGSSSPLPSFQTEDLFAEASNDKSISREFFDILHQRLYQLCFQVWSKCQLFIRVAEEKNPLERERLFCLIGLGERELRGRVPEAWSLMRYAGLLTQFPRSAAGLMALLRDALGIAGLAVEQCVLRKVPIPREQRMRTGMTGMNLGSTTVLGNVIADRMGKFRIIVGPLKKKEFDRFLPGGDQHGKLARLVRLYIIDPLDFDLKLILAAKEAPPMKLGDRGGQRLGYDSWSFSGATIGEVSVCFPLEEPIWRETQPEQEPAGPSTLTELYQQELALLRELTTDYVKTHPVMAPLMSGHMPDPGVERVMEGAAFLWALLRLKLDDDIPELIHPIMEALDPEALRPVPASTIVAFTPRQEHAGPLVIPAGSEVDSIPVEGTRCRFRTCFDVTAHPLVFLDSLFSQPAGKAARISLNLELRGVSLSTWNVSTLRLFLGDEYPRACDLYLLLMRYLKRIVITAHDTGEHIQLPPDRLKPVGFADHDGMLSKEKTFMPGHRILREYFLFPDKFLFLDLNGLEGIHALGKCATFEIAFELANNLPLAPKVTEKSFVLSAAPAVNLFRHSAKQLVCASSNNRQKILPSGKKPQHYTIYSVDRVVAIDTETVRKREIIRQAPYHHQPDMLATCRITRHQSALEHGLDSFLTMAGHNTMDKTKRLGIELTCTNGTLPEQLDIGDICIASATSPETVSFRNIKPVTAHVSPVREPNRLWRLLSGFSLNRCSLDIESNLRAILTLFVSPGNRSHATLAANQKRVDAIASVTVKPSDKLMGRAMYRGYCITVKLRVSHFTGFGDMFLFCSALERFLGGYVTQSCFIQLTVEDMEKKYQLEWPARMGDRDVL